MANCLDEGRFVRTMLDFLIDNVAIILETVALVYGTFSQSLLNISFSTYGWWFETEVELQSFRHEHCFALIWIPLILLVLAIIVRAFTAKRIASLESDLNEIKESFEQFRSLSENVKLIIDQHLRVIGNELGFTASERVSLYVYRINAKHKKEFTQCGRYSVSESLKVPGRASYPINQGVIWKAWDIGNFEKTQLPDWDVDRQKYLNICVSEFGFTKRCVKRLTMHPRYIYGCRIGDAGGTNYRSVIIIESKNPEFNTGAEVKRIVDNHREALFSFVRDFYGAIPALPRTMERGF